MNRTLSDDTDAVLALQGVGWLTRKAIAWATVTLAIKQYTPEEGTTHIDIEQTATGGIKGTSELRTLDWVAREHSDHMFGDLKGRSRWLTDLKSDVSGNGGPLDPFCTEGWLDEKVGPNGEGFIQSFVVNEKNGWSAEQVWGFAIIDGVRYHTRRVIVKKGSELLKVRLVYDFQE